jgi:hypothetical protein
MKRRLNNKVMGNYVNAVGDVKNATALIEEKLQCSKSKAEKLASCRYPSIPTPMEQMALAELLGVTRDTLYPPIIKTSEKRAS